MQRLTIDNAPECLAEALNVHGALVIAVAHNGCIQVASTANLNHQAVVGHLALAIHAVLSDHDARVLAGEAGEQARDLFENLANGARQ